MRVVYGLVVSVKLWAAINCDERIVSCIHIIFFNSTCCVMCCLCSINDPMLGI
jgi:hypothetical protein